MLTTSEVLALLEPARAQGYVFIVWTPTELEGVTPVGIEALEERSIELGNRIIYENKEPSSETA